MSINKYGVELWSGDTYIPTDRDCEIIAAKVNDYKPPPPPPLRLRDLFYGEKFRWQKGPMSIATPYYIILNLSTNANKVTREGESQSIAYISPDFRLFATNDINETVVRVP